MIIGGGLSGLQLLNALLSDQELSNKRIAIIEANQSPIEKTWCFWEKRKGQWENLIYHQWEAGEFIDDDGSLDLKMNPYTYKMIRSEELVAHFKELIKEHSNIEWIYDKVKAIDIENSLATSDSAQYHGELIFDSRFDPEELEANDHPQLLQHFKGWFIKTEKDQFDPGKFLMMDFRLPFSNLCSFTYILPFSHNEALVEYTFFSSSLLKEEKYDQLITAYLKEYFGTVSYQKIGEEKGVIPMTTYPFQKKNKENYHRIGTAGGWVKASSGYSFKHAEKKSAQLVKNIKAGKPLQHNLTKRRFKLYDRVFLNLLEEENELGNQLFQQMYRNNQASSIFRFLDEESSFIEELKLINRFDHAPFLRAFRREFL